MQKIKVLMVAGTMHVGGIENQLMHLARNVDKDRFQIDFTSTMPEAFYRDEIEALGGRFILISKMNWKNPTKYCRELLKVMREGQYDIVHSHELFHSGITLYLAYKSGIPCRFVHAHNWCDDDGTGRVPDWKRKIYRWIMRKMICKYSTVQIGCSTWAGKFVYGEKTLKKASYHLVYNSVDTIKFLNKYENRETGEFCDDGWINVLNVGRLTAVKNQLFLVDIAEEFRKRRKKIRILCAGNGDEEYISALEAKIKKKQLQGYIQLLGVRKDIDVLMRKSSAFLLPSKYEGMPLVLIEAQASGLPCVIADTFSHEVDFKLGMIDWLPLNGDFEMWADAVELSIQKERALKQDVSTAVKKYGFDSRTFAKKICRLYVHDYERKNR